MKKTILTFFIFALSFSMFAQGDILIINSPSGYLNVRERPTVDSRLMGTMSRHKVFVDARWYKDRDFLYAVDFPPNWRPVIFWGLQHSYVYKPFTKRLWDLPTLDLITDCEGNFWNPDAVIVANDSIRVELLFQPFSLDNHRDYSIKENVHVNFLGERSVTRQIVGLSTGAPRPMLGILIEHPNCVFEEPIANFLAELREIASLTVYKNDERWELPIRNIRHFFFTPGSMTVSVGLHGELYIEIWVGDASETYAIVLSVANGQIVNVTNLTP